MAGYAIPGGGALVLKIFSKLNIGGGGWFQNLICCVNKYNCHIQALYHERSAHEMLVLLQYYVRYNFFENVSYWPRVAPGAALILSL